VPNAGEYRRHADRFAAEAERIDALVGALERRPLGGIGGGPLLDAGVEQLAEIVATLHDATRELQRLADECRRRAVVCDDYARRVADYWARPVHLRLGTVMPIPPYPWASA
jgi:hypothetical protein